MIKEDCFAYIKSKNKCSALKELYCGNKECSFYRNKKDIKMSDIERDIRNYISTKK